MKSTGRRDPSRGSGPGVDGDFERLTNLSHPIVAQSTESFDEYAHRDALNGVEIHGASSWDRIVAGFQLHFTRQVAECGGARSDQRSPKPGNRNVTREHDDRSATDVGKLAPPHLAARGISRHEAAARSRNDAKSPHSSVSLSGCSSNAEYAASISPMKP